MLDKWYFPSYIHVELNFSRRAPVRRRPFVQSAVLARPFHRLPEYRRFECKIEIFVTRKTYKSFFCSFINFYLRFNALKLFYNCLFLFWDFFKFSIYSILTILMNQFILVLLSMFAGVPTRISSRSSVKNESLYIHAWGLDMPKGGSG